MTQKTNDGTPRATPLAAYALVAALCGALGFGAIYATRPSGDNGAVTGGISAAVAEPAPEADRKALSSGGMITFVFRKAPETVPAFTFTDEANTPKSLADFKGRVVLLNLWATWCVPCRKEMPALERLQKELGGDSFEVVALSVDRAGIAASRKFLDEAKVAGLKLYAESSAKSVGLMRATGLPTSILIDREGREVGRLAGPAEWDGTDAERLIKSVIEAK